MWTFGYQYAPVNGVCTFAHEAISGIGPGFPIVAFVGGAAEGCELTENMLAMVGTVGAELDKVVAGRILERWVGVGVEVNAATAAAILKQRMVGEPQLFSLWCADGGL